MTRVKRATEKRSETSGKKGRKIRGQGITKINRVKSSLKTPRDDEERRGVKGRGKRAERRREEIRREWHT